MKDLATYNMLKNITLADVIRIVVQNDDLNINVVNEEKEVYYTSKDLIDLYPNIFSKYKLARYIKEEKKDFFLNQV